VPDCQNEADHLIGDDAEKKILQLCGEHFPDRDKLWGELARAW
jgi:hypothetical protein